MKKILSLFVFLFCVGMTNATPKPVTIKTETHEKIISTDTGDSFNIAVIKLQGSKEFADGNHNEGKRFDNTSYPAKRHFNNSAFRYSEDSYANKQNYSSTYIKALGSGYSFSKKSREYFRSRMYSGRTTKGDSLTARNYYTLQRSYPIPKRHDNGTEEKDTRNAETCALDRLCYYSWYNWAGDSVFC